jgi:hypothetical protein
MPVSAGGIGATPMPTVTVSPASGVLATGVCEPVDPVESVEDAVAGVVAEEPPPPHPATEKTKMSAESAINIFIGTPHLVINWCP